MSNRIYICYNYSYIQSELFLFFIIYLLKKLLISYIIFLFCFHYSLVGIQRRISQGLKVLQYYTTKNWTFKNEKFLKMKEHMSADDKIKFNFSVEEVWHKNMILKLISVLYFFFVCYLQINWDEYVGLYILGARHYLLKEKPESLPQARILLRRLYFLDKFVSILFYGLLLWLIYSYWDNIIYGFEAVLDSSANFINQRFVRV